MQGADLAPLQLAFIEKGVTSDDPEQRQLAGAVASDQSKPLADLHDELCSVQERSLTESDVRVAKCDQGHELIVRIE
jgi:hypothetical protein